MKTHNFLIVSTRPELLTRQVKSFASVRQERVLNFYVFNDTNKHDDEFLAAINALNDCYRAEPVRVFYISLQQQTEILHDFSQGASALLATPHKVILECFMEQGRLQGIRSVQNKSILIFYLLNKDLESIIHKVDDDVVAVNAERTGQDVVMRRIDDYFLRKESSIGDNPNLISGSDYSIDTPSPLVELADFVDFYDSFFKKAVHASEHRIVGDAYIEINPNRALSYDDLKGLLDLAPPSSTDSYAQVVLRIKTYVEMLDSGRSRVTINDTGRDNIAKDTFFPGGCVSINYSYQPGLTPLFGNQDLLWELFEFHRGKGLVVDGYIGHVKVHSNRKPILEDLTDESYKHQTKLTYAVSAALTAQHPNQATDAFNRQFIAQSDQWLREIDHFVEGILTSLQHNDQWFRKDKYRSNITALQSFLDLYQSKRDAVRLNYSDHEVDGQALVDKYTEMNALFLKLIDLAKISPAVDL